MAEDQGWDEVPEPSHHLLVELSGERPLVFAEEAGSGPVRREWVERRVTTSSLLADMLGLTAGDAVVERVMRLLVGPLPVLLSRSYVPVGLAAVADGWQDVPVGQLALAGFAVRSVGLEQWSRWPTAAEIELLDCPRDVPVLVLSHRCEVSTDADVIPAGALVVARGDQVYLRLRG